MSGSRVQSAAALDAAADEATRSRIAELAERHGLDLVVLFGSRATGLARTDSDADLAVRASAGVASAGVASAGVIDVLDLLELAEPFARVLGVTKADMVDLGTADPLLLRQIFANGLPLFERDGAFERERLRAFHRYSDYRPYLELERNAVRRKLGLDAPRGEADSRATDGR